MSNSNFFIMKDAYGEFARAIEKSNKWKVEQCDLCNSYLRIKTNNLHVSFMGKRVADFYRIPQYSIISQKMQLTLIEHKVTGFNFDDIIVEDSSIELPENHILALKELVIYGDGGFLHHLDGSVIRKCEHCGKILEDKHSVNGLSVNPEQWDGSDIFYFKNWFGMIIVTEKVKTIIEAENLINIDFVHLSQFRFI